MIAGDAVRRALRNSADRTLVYWRDQAWPGAAIDDEVDRLADFLQGVGPGAHVGLWYQNSVWALIAHLAVERAGLTRVPVDPGAPADEARAIWAAAGVELVVGDSQLVADLAGAVAYDEASQQDAAGRARDVEVAGDATHLLFPRTVSSGGLLAIPISYHGWAAHMATNSRLFRDGGYGPHIDASDTLLTVQQMMHGTGLVATFPFLLMGIPQVVVDRFDVAVVAEAAARHRTTTAFMVPGMVTRLAGWAEEHGRLPFRRIVYGGAPITPEELRHALTHLGPVMTQIYGRLEGGWPLTVLSTEDHQRIADGDDTLLDSCGRVVSEVELDTRPVGDPRAHGGGELRVRGAMTSPAFTDPDGWCSLGDLATVDDDGYVRLHGRVDGMINTGSYHVYPQEVEEAIRELPEVLNVTISAVPDPKWGEAVLATITWPSGYSPPDDGDLRTSLRTRLAHYKVPTRFSHHHDGSTGRAATQSMTSTGPQYLARQKRRADTHERVIQVAADLFYKRGIQQVSMDDIAAAAHVTKATLYKHFSSKDVLISQCLEIVDLEHFTWFVAQVDKRTTRGMPALDAVFDALDQWINSSVFRGCAFINASIQLPDHQHPAFLAVLNHKDRTRRWLVTLATEDGFTAESAELVGSHLMLLMEGAIVTALVQGRADAGKEAGDVARIVLEAHGVAARVTRAPLRPSPSLPAQPSTP